MILFNIYYIYYINNKFDYFNQNKTYDRLIKYNIKKFLFMDTKEKNKKNSKNSLKSLIINQKSRQKKKLMFKNNTSINNYFNTYYRNYSINEKYKSKKNNTIKIRPKTSFLKYKTESNYKKNINIKFLNNISKKESLNIKNNFKINIVDFTLELNSL